MLDNSYQFVSQAHPEAIASRATELASDINFGANIRLKRPKEYAAAYNELASQSQKTGAQVGQDDLKLAATAKVISDDLKKEATYLEERSKPQGNQPFNLGLNFGGGTSGVSGIAGAGNTIPVAVSYEPTNGTAFTKQGNVITGDPHSFHTVSVINTNSQNSIDAGTNQPLGQQVFEELKVGDAVAVPIAVRDIKDQRTGRTYKKGQMIDSDAVDGLKQGGLVEYVPMFKGIGTYTKGNKKKTVSTLTPVQQTADAVLLSQSANDAPLTKQNIQAAIDDATRMNEALNKRFKTTTTPAAKAKTGVKSR